MSDTWLDGVGTGRIMVVSRSTARYRKGTSGAVSPGSEPPDAAALVKVIDVFFS